MKILLSLLFFIPPVYSSQSLEKLYKIDSINEKAYKELEAKTLKLSNKAVPTLIKVMKSSAYPDKNRWLATMSLARIMGEKSLPFIKKFLKHPHWILRLASLKVIRILKKKNLKREIEAALFDRSMFIRVEALDMVGDMQMHRSAPAVWKMLFDQKNYRKNKKGGQEKTEIIKRIIQTLGRLKYKPVRSSLAKLLKNSQFKDLTPEIDHSLVQMTGIRSPKIISSKKKFWLSQKL